MGGAWGARLSHKGDRDCICVQVNVHCVYNTEHGHFINTVHMILHMWGRIRKHTNPLLCIGRERLAVCSGNVSK